MSAGLKNGTRTLVEPKGRNRYGISWLWRCDCGQSGECTVPQFKRKGRCIVCIHSAWISKIDGKQVNSLTFSIPETLINRVIVECLCGNKREVSRSTALSMIKRDQRACQKCEWIAKRGMTNKPHGQRKPVEPLISVVLRNYKREAWKRGFEWNISDSQAMAIFQQDCYYCGSPPTNVATCTKLDISSVYSGIDRVDNTEGYSPNNIVPCCKVCNFMKGGHDVVAFFSQCHRIASLHTEGP